MDSLFFYELIRLQVHSHASSTRTPSPRDEEEEPQGEGLGTLSGDCRLLPVFRETELFGKTSSGIDEQRHVHGQFDHGPVVDQ